MGGLSLLARAHLRRRWRPLAVLILLTGVVGGLLLSTAAGARRSGSALARFNDESRSSDLTVVDGGVDQIATPAQLAALRAVPGVEAVGVGRGYVVNFPTLPNLIVVAPVDSSLGGDVDRARIVRGRAPAPDATDEITVSETLAKLLGVDVGGHVDVTSITPDQATEAFTQGGLPTAPAGPPLRLRVVGIDRRPLDLGDSGAVGGILLLPPGFDRAYAGRIGTYGSILRIRTADPAHDIPTVTAAAKRIFAGSAFVDTQSVAAESQGARNAIGVLTSALWIFGAVAAIAGFAAVSITVTREIGLAAADQPTLRALGLTRRQRMGLGMSSGLLIALGGALTAMVIAAAASRFFPLGVARRADPDVGLHVDWLAFGVGGIGVVAVVVAIAGLAALRRTRPLLAGVDDPGPRRSTATVPEMAARAGMGPAATYGLSMAFDQRRTSGAPVRFTYLGAVLGVLGLTAVLVFGSSLQHLAASPRLQGWDWDFAVTDNTTTACGRTDPGLAQIDGVADIAGLCEADIPVDGRPVAAWGFSRIRGSIEPAIVAGRAPSGPNEVALGSITLHALGKKIGDDVELGVQLEGSEPGTEIRYVIVGETVIPTYDNSGPLADVAALTEPGFDQVIDESSNGDRLLVGTYAPGADTTRVTRQVGALGLTGLATAVEIQRIREVNWLPLALGTLLAGLATLAVGHALVTSVHRRRHDIAMLKALGFDRRQIRAAITWQATTLVGVALAVGIPSGLFVGRAVWRTVATDLGVRSSAPLPTVAPGLIVPVALLVAYLGGRVLSRQAVQSRPAVVLRTD